MGLRCSPWREVYKDILDRHADYPDKFYSPIMSSKAVQNGLTVDAQQSFPVDEGPDHQIVVDCADARRFLCSHSECSLHVLRID